MAFKRSNQTGVRRDRNKGLRITALLDELAASSTPSNLPSSPTTSTLEDKVGENQRSPQNKTQVPYEFQHRDNTRTIRHTPEEHHIYEEQKLHLENIGGLAPDEKKVALEGICRTCIPLATKYETDDPHYAMAILIIAANAAEKRAKIDNPYPWTFAKYTAQLKILEISTNIGDKRLYKQQGFVATATKELAILEKEVTKKLKFGKLCLQYCDEASAGAEKCSDIPTARYIYRVIADVTEHMHAFVDDPAEKIRYLEIAYDARKKVTGYSDSAHAITTINNAIKTVELLEQNSNDKQKWAQEKQALVARREKYQQPNPPNNH